MRDAGRRSPLLNPALIAAVVIGMATLYPTHAVPVSGGSLCVFCGERGLADFLLNVGLFVPLGAGLRWRRVRLWLAAALGLGLTVFIEAAQVTVVPGRDASVGDLVANFSGTVVGWMLVHLYWRTGLSAGGRLAGRVVPLLASLALVCGLWLLRPDPPATIYYAQWTADFGNMERYEGRVVGSAVGEGGLADRPGRIAESDAVRRSLRGAEAVAVSFEAGPAPEGVAPVFSVYDEGEVEVFLLGVDHADVVYRERMRARAIRLDQPVYRFPGVLDSVGAGTTVRLRLDRRPDGYCVEVGAAPGEPASRTCAGGFTVGDTWQLLYSLAPSGPRRALAGAGWVFLVVLGLALLTGSGRHVPGLALGALVLWLGPTALGFAATPLFQVLGYVAALWLAPALARLAGERGLAPPPLAATAAAAR